MQVLNDVGSWRPPSGGTVLTIGAYDGLHRGHQAVIARVRDVAAGRGAASAVVTFDRHPASVVRPESAPRLLTSPEQKLELLAATGIDVTLLVRFDERRAGEDAREFVIEVLVDGLGMKAIVVGEDFHFGRGRGGNVALLRTMGEEFGFEVIGLPLLDRPDAVPEPVSSTAIRRALAGGDVGSANQMLGRAFEVRGPVERGDQRGRTIGFPTANVLVPDNICMPADGVYAGIYERPDGSRHGCAINLGRRPTFYEHAEASLLEAHLLDFDGDLYGESAKVRFLTFLRSERKFDGIESLKHQLVLDVAAAREATATHLG